MLPVSRAIPPLVTVRLPTSVAVDIYLHPGLPGAAPDHAPLVKPWLEVIFEDALAPFQATVAPMPRRRDGAPTTPRATAAASHDLQAVPVVSRVGCVEVPQRLVPLARADARFLTGVLQYVRRQVDRLPAAHPKAAHAQALRAEHVRALSDEHVTMSRIARRTARRRPGSLAALRAWVAESAARLQDELLFLDTLATSVPALSEDDYVACLPADIPWTGPLPPASAAWTAVHLSADRSVRNSVAAGGPRVVLAPKRPHLYPVAVVPPLPGAAPARYANFAAPGTHEAAEEWTSDVPVTVLQVACNCGWRSPLLEPPAATRCVTAHDRVAPLVLTAPTFYARCHALWEAHLPPNVTPIA